MNKRRQLGLAVAALLLVGAGCDLGSAVNLRNPFEFGGSVTTEKPYALTVGTGATFTVRPSALGIGGTIAELLGNDDGAREVTVKAYSPDRLAIAWRDLASASGTPASGTIESSSWSSAHAMLVPAFWKAGDVEADGNGMLWLSPTAYQELTTNGSTDWRVALGGVQLAPLAQKALTAFETIAAKLAMQGSTTSTAPFRISQVADVPSYPLRVNGNIEHVAAIRASGWFAELLILKNPASPLILNVTVHPAALAALKALEPLGGDPAAFGYEVTDVTAK